MTYSTVQTILRILETKGYVTHDKVARAFVYEPVVDERQARRRALRHLVRRLFEGSPSLLVLNVLEDEDTRPGGTRTAQETDRARLGARDGRCAELAVAGWRGGGGVVS